MNWKLTVLLVFVAAAVGAFAYFNPFAETPERQARSPWFYQVSMDDIVKIDVTAGEDSVGFNKNDQGSWEFDDIETVPPDHYRWGGIVLLLSGPSTRRDISEVRPTIDDPAEYGLDAPVLVAKVGLIGDRSLEFRLGDETTDGYHHYGQVIGFPQLYLIADSWGDVLARIANEPPIPKWWQTRDPETIVELNIYLGEPGEPDAPHLRLQKEEDVWFARNFATDEENRPLDPEKLAEFLPLLGGPGGITVDQYRVRDRDYGDWGISDDGHHIEIRFAGVTDRGTKFTDGVLFLIGDKTPDGKNYYAVPASDITSTPVVILDAKWSDTFFDLVSNVPYGEESESEDSE